jgi:hypothetical protein
MRTFDGVYFFVAKIRKESQEFDKAGRIFGEVYNFAYMFTVRILSVYKGAYMFTNSCTYSNGAMYTCL